MRNGTIVDSNAFPQQLDALNGRIHALQQRATSQVTEGDERLLTAIEELQGVLQELRLAEAEIRQPNDAWATAYHTVDVERQRYQELFDFAPDGYLVTDTAGVIVEANRAAADLLAASQADLLGRPLMAFVAGSDRRVFRSRLAQLTPASHRQLWDVWLRPRRGRPFYAAMAVAAVHDSDRQLTGLRWIIRDIMHRKQTQDLLEDERNFIATVLDTIDALVVILDPHGRIMRFNRACERLTGYTAEEVRDQQVWDLFVFPEEIEPVQAVFQALAAGQAQNTYVHHWHTRHGQPRRIRWTNATCFDAAGRVACVIATGIDMTDLIQAQQDLQASAAKTRAIVETAIDGIITIDVEGRIESFNPAAERLFGYRAAEVIGHNISQLMPSPYREAHDGYLARYLLTGERKIIGIGREVQGQRRDGTIFPMDLTVSEVTVGDRRLFTGIVRDLSERIRMEQELRHADRLALVGQLASGLAHEIGTPLNVISGNAELLHLQLIEEQGKSRAELETIVAQADRITRLMGQLLTFARPQPSPPMTAISLHEPLGDALRLLETRFGREGITVHVDLTADVPRVYGGADQLEQVFLNVLINAWHAMPGGGIITVRAGTTHDGQVQLAFCDTGSGMSAAAVARAFEPFYTTKQERGTGMGLAICQQIITSCRGTLSLQSTPGEGTTVTMTLPQAEPDDPSRAWS